MTTAAEKNAPGVGPEASYASDDDGKNHRFKHTLNGGAAQEPSAQAVKLLELFAGNPNGHAVFTTIALVPVKGGGTKLDCIGKNFVHKPVAAIEWDDHLYGRGGIGTSAILPNSTVRFACIDPDSHPNAAGEKSNHAIDRPPSSPKSRRRGCRSCRS